MKKNHLKAEIKKISILIIIKGIKSKRHNTSKYVRFKIYLFNKIDIVILMKREFHVIDNLTIKVFIKINIIKPKIITIDLENKIIRIDIYKELEIFIIVFNREESRTSIIIYNNKKIVISSYINIVVLISRLKNRLKLSKNRNFIFKF